MRDSQVSWRAEGSGANLHCGPLVAYADIDDGSFSLTIRCWNDQDVQGATVLWSKGPGEASLDVSERIIRGCDFIASCNAAGPDRITPQIYWRASLAEHGSTARVELVLSARTDLLDSLPQWHLLSSVKGARRFYVRNLKRPTIEDITNLAKRFVKTHEAEHLFLLRIESIGVSFAQMVHPTDFVEANAHDGGEDQMIEMTLFPERLEKGVIRRGRVCGWFMPLENDLETAVKLAREFVEEPLPLTA